MARSRGSGRGFSVDVLVLDEAEELSEDALAALLPTISVSPNPQRIYTGTPPRPNAEGESFTRVRTAGLVGEDPSLCWQEWGCAHDADLDDPGDALQLIEPLIGAQQLNGLVSELGQRVERRRNFLEHHRTYTRNLSTPTDKLLAPNTIRP